MDLKLTRSSYREFLRDFREADKSAAQGALVEVAYSDGGTTTTYYFKAPNFYLDAYDVGGARVQLTDQAYPKSGFDKGSFNLDDLKKALQAGGGGSTNMSGNLCIVTTFISEAARSKVVEQKMLGVFLHNGSVKLSALEFLFKEYGKTVKALGYWANNGYLPGWRPLDKTDYERYFVPAGPNQAKNLSDLKLL